MLKCPSCDATLDQDFGMVTCSQCQSVLMIDLNGQVQVAGEYDPSEEYQAAEESTDGDGFETAVDDDATDPPEESYTAPDDFEPVQTLDNEFNDDTTGFAETYEGGDEVSQDYDPIASDVDQLAASEADEQEDYIDDTTGVEQSYPDSEEDFDSETGSVAEPLTDQQQEVEAVAEEDDEPPMEEPDESPEVFAMPAEPDPDPVDITDYANSEVSNLEDGEFLYDVTVSRLDSKDLKEALKYVLLDEKLKLNHHEYLKKIKDGEVTIPNLNPLKAKRIVEQLQYHSLVISWKQKRVVMQVLEPEDDEQTGDFDDTNAEDANA